MSTSSQVDRSLRSYLEQGGWIQQASGPIGALWRSSASEEADVVAVPWGDIRPGEREWRSVVERIALHEHRGFNEVATRISNQFTDITHLQAANDLVIADSIPLSAGVSLVSSAKDMLRSSATTAQRARSQIDGNFSKVGDDLADQARLGHTINGSYVIPVLMPLSDPPQDRSPALTGLEQERAAHEPPERRVMRTFAEAMTAIDKIVVEPDREPRQKDIPDLILAGVSREFVSALKRIVTEPAVATFEATFQWAPALVGPSSVPAKVVIPAASSYLLERTVKLLKSTRQDPPQSITGPIVEVRQLPGDSFGEVAVQTIRNGRPSEIRVRLRSDQIDESHEWMRTAKTVVVDGVITRTPGRPLRIDAPTRYTSLEATFLNSQED